MYRYAFLLFSLACGPLLSSENGVKKMEQEIKNKRFKNIAKRLKRNQVALKDVKAIAKKHHATAVINAVDATRKIAKYHKNLPVKRHRVLETALYIETEFQKAIKKHKYYRSKHKTGLPYTVEHDPSRKSTFIAIQDKKTYIGRGAFKKVYKAIHYNHEHPKVVARAEEKAKGVNEHALTKKVHGMPGVYETVGFGKHKAHGYTYHTTYSKLYRPGSLHDVLEKKTRLTLYEKMKVARDILQGLSSIHSKGIVHKDLGARNYLVEIPKKRRGFRNVRACIADLGCADYARKSAKTKVVGNTKYTPPEGLYLDKMRPNDYYKSDIYTTGCVLYWLFYGKKPSWIEKSYVNDVSGSLDARYKELSSRIENATKKRRNTLIKKGSKKSPKERFEQLILQMLEVNPNKRGTAKANLEKMERICKKGISKNFREL